MTPTRARVGDTVRILVQGFQVSIPVHPHRRGGGAVPMDNLASTPALYGVGLVALGCIMVPTLVHPWAFWLYPVLALGVRQGLPPTPISQPPHLPTE